MKTPRKVLSLMVFLLPGPVAVRGAGERVYVMQALRDIFVEKPLTGGVLFFGRDWRV